MVKGLCEELFWGGDAVFLLDQPAQKEKQQRFGQMSIPQVFGNGDGRNQGTLIFQGEINVNSAKSEYLSRETR